MSGWEIAALLREAEQVRNNYYLDDAERAQRLELIRGEVIAAGGDGALVGVPTKPRQAAARATRSSKTAAERKKAS